MDHIIRVHKLAMQFAQEEAASEDIVELAALLHEVDDYKIFGEDSARNLTNASQILEEAGVDKETKLVVLDIIKTMGYNKYLEGVRPSTIEGMIVSDADMCDAIGAQGILRTHAFNISKGKPFFDKGLVPTDSSVDAEKYRSAPSAHSVQHFFDKLLTIPGILMTESGRDEGAKRQKIMIDFLEELFREEDATDWSEHLSKLVGR